MTNRVNWTIDTRAIQPRNLQVLRGETVALDVDLTSYGSPVDLAGATCSAFWRSPDMASGAAWYSSPATCSGNRVLWVWDGATMDAGAEVYEWFIGVDGDGLSYRPCGRIQMLGSPAGNPSAIPIPSPVLDFAKYTVVNSPFPTFAEEGAAIDAATSGKVDTSALVETLGDYYTAAQTDTAIEAATSALVGVSALSAYMDAEETRDAIQSATEATTSGKADRADLALYLPLSGGMMGVGGTLTFAGQQGSRGAVWMDGVTLTVSNRDPGGALSRYAFSPFNIDAVAKKSDVDAATSGKADRSDLALHLPLSGGRINGTLSASTVITDYPAQIAGRQYGLNSISLGENHLDFPAGNGIFAKTSDIQAATSALATSAAVNASVIAASGAAVLSAQGYTDSIVGDINAILDTINGEVI